MIQVFYFVAVDGENQKNDFKIFTWRLIKNIVKLSIFGYGFYVEHGSQIVQVTACLQSPLKRKQRRILKIHHSKPRHEKVMYAVSYPVFITDILHFKKSL